MIYMENLYFGENICSCYQKGMQPKSTPGNDAIIECIDTKYSIEEWLQKRYMLCQHYCQRNQAKY